MWHVVHEVRERQPRKGTAAFARPPFLFSSLLPCSGQKKTICTTAACEGQKKKNREGKPQKRKKKEEKNTHTRGAGGKKKKMLNKAVTTVQSVATYSVSGIEHGGDYVSLNTTRVEATKRRTEKKKKGSRRKALPYSNKTAVLFVVACFLLLLCLCVAVALSCSFDSCSATTWHGKKKNERKTLKQKNVRDSSSSQVTVSHHTNRKKKKLTRRRIRWEMGIPP